MDKNKKTKKTEKGKGYGLFAAAFVVAAGVFAVMTYMQKEALSEMMQSATLPIQMSGHIRLVGTISENRLSMAE